MDKLKYCPYCEETKKLRVMQSTNRWAFVHCDACGAEGPADLGESGAIERWNTRPREDRLFQEIVALMKENLQ